MGTVTICPSLNVIIPVYYSFCNARLGIETPNLRGQMWGKPRDPEGGEAIVVVMGKVTLNHSLHVIKSQLLQEARARATGPVRGTVTLTHRLNVIIYYYCCRMPVWAKRHRGGGATGVVMGTVTLAWFCLGARELLSREVSGGEEEETNGQSHMNVNEILNTS
ncbi:hypothetical protein J6590_056570 [Homalodisca vitripennis]|nr:hypothetical protein J6590_056570 [Homalodisca vitripennis]